jgi:hypothetical protein
VAIFLVIFFFFERRGLDTAFLLMGFGERDCEMGSEVEVIYVSATYGGAGVWVCCKFRELLVAGCEGERIRGMANYCLFI